MKFFWLSRFSLFLLCSCLFFPLPVLANSALSVGSMSLMHFLWVVPLEALIFWGMSRWIFKRDAGFFLLLFISLLANICSTFIGALIPFSYSYGHKYDPQVWWVFSIAFVFTVIFESGCYLSLLRKHFIPKGEILLLVWCIHIASYGIMIPLIPDEFAFGFGGRGAKESGAVGSLRAIFSAEEQFQILKRGDNQYGTLAELSSNNLFSGIPLPTRNKYMFLIKLRKDGRAFEVYSFPFTEEDGGRNFCLFSDGKITFTTNLSQVPTDRDVPID